MTSNIRVLFIDDDHDDVQLVVRVLAASGYEVLHTRVDTRDGLNDALESATWDIAIGDFQLRRMSGASALRTVRGHDPDMPFVFVSGTAGEEAAVTAIKSGAHDYIRKGNLRRLTPSVRRELREAAQRRERRKADQRLAHLAYHDGLTDLPNRMLLKDRLEQAVRMAHRHMSNLALIVLDLDGFKQINDTQGHHAGDRVLQHVASSVRGLLRDADTVARLGGDEFAIVLPATDVAGATLAARRAVKEIERPCFLERSQLSVRASAGIACFPDHARSAEMLMQKADVAMYMAKSAGIGVTVYTPKRDRRTDDRLTLVSELFKAVEKRQFFLEYQPVLHLRSHVPIAVEAFVRWNHPRHGRMLPGSFLRLMEQTGLINPLTSLVLDMALADWPAVGPLPVTVSVNLSARNLEDPDLPHLIADALDAHGAAPSSLALEVTENIVMADPTRSMESLKRIHGMGVSLIIDDFGTGYSSLSYLRRLPVSGVKIDRSFVADLDRTSDDVIPHATIDLAHHLGLTVTAEGVEREPQQVRLTELGCDAAQGTAIAPPATAAATREWLAHQNLLGLM